MTGQTFRRAHLSAIAYELGPEVLTTAELEERLAPALDRLRLPLGQLEELTGISERRLWAAGFNVAEGAARAATKLLRKLEIPATAVEQLVYGGVCRVGFEPATAAHVAAAMAARGAEVSIHAELHDVGNACLGALTGVLAVARAVELGAIGAGLVVTCESARDIVDIAVAALVRDPSPERLRTTLATLTGGSAAVALLVHDGRFGGGRRLLGAVHRNAPRHHDLCRWGVETPADALDVAQRREFMTTDAVAVLEHGVALGRGTWADLLATLGWTAQTVDRTIMHQVGRAHRDAILAALQVPGDRDFSVVEQLGNCGSAALPVAAAIAEERGVLEAGQRVALLGIGSGLHCTMVGVQW
jgi:3-oxoacyl-[acyl-carrier-protein] synthase-3